MRTPTASRASDAQIEAGNYRRARRFWWNGLEICIETPRHARRRPGWPKLRCDYGYIRRTMGADGDQVDVFVGPHLDSDLVVVIDQVTPGKRFDEHKALIGFKNKATALAAYRRCYTAGWRVGPQTAMTVYQFKAWLRHGDTTKRVGPQCGKYGAAQLSLWEEDKHPRDDRGRFAKAGKAWQSNMDEDAGEWIDPRVFPQPSETIRPDDSETISQADADARVETWKRAAKDAGKHEDNSHKIIFSLFDRTGNWSQPWADAGYTVIQYDAELGDDLLHYFPIEDIKEAVNHPDYEVYGVLAAPPCTTMASSGARWWKTRHDVPNEPDLQRMFGVKALQDFDTPHEYNATLVEMTRLFVEMTAPTDFYVAENPRGRMGKYLADPEGKKGNRDPLMRFEPHHYGDPYTKETGLWGDFATDLPTANVEPTKGSAIHKMSSSNPARSITPEGFAYAFFMANHRPGPSQYAAETFAEAIARYATQLGFQWDEEKHPRDEGGKFTEPEKLPSDPKPAPGPQPKPKATPAAPARLTAALKKEGITRVRNFAGGIAWAHDEAEGFWYPVKDDGTLDYRQRIGERAGGGASRWEYVRDENAQDDAATLKELAERHGHRRQQPTAKLDTKAIAQVKRDLLALGAIYAEHPDVDEYGERDDKKLHRIREKANKIEARIEAGKETIGADGRKAVETWVESQAAPGMDNFNFSDQWNYAVNNRPETFAEAIARYRAKQMKFDWVTIGANKDAPAGEKGGTPVAIGKGGKIVAGPDKLEGKTIGSLDKDKPKPKPTFGGAIEKYREKKKAEETEARNNKYRNPLYHGRPKQTEGEEKAVKELEERHKTEPVENFYDERSKLLEGYQRRVDQWERETAEKFVSDLAPNFKDLKGKKPHEVTQADYSRIAALKRVEQVKKDQKKWGPMIDRYKEAKERGDWQEVDKAIHAMEDTRGYQALKKRYTNWDGKPGSFYDVAEQIKPGKELVSWDELADYRRTEDHKQAVLNAMKKGEEVPGKVLDDYIYSEDFKELVTDKHKRTIKIDNNVEDEKQSRKTADYRLDARRGRELRDKARKFREKDRQAFIDIAEKISKGIEADNTAAWEKYYAKQKEGNEAARDEAMKAPAVQRAAAKKEELREVWSKSSDADDAAAYEQYNQARKREQTLIDTYGKGSDRAQAFAAEAAKLKDDWTKKRAEGRKKLAKQVADSLAELSPHVSSNTITIARPANAPKDYHDKIETAEKFLNAFAHPVHKVNIGVEYVDEWGRAHANGTNMKLNSNSDVATIIHEAGHNIEHNRDHAAGERSKKFMRAQVIQDEAVHFGDAYQDYEVGSKDGFLNQYSGKSYGGRGSTEVLSMGLQHLYEDPITFAKDSPDHFNWTLATILGDFDK